MTTIHWLVIACGLFAVLYAIYAGRTVLAARCSELESTYAFGVVRQLFEARLRTSAQWLDGSAGSAAAVFDPPRSGFADDVSHSVLHGLYWLTANACAERFVALFIDDATGATAPACASSPTSPDGSTGCRCSSWSPRAQASAPSRRRCSPTSPARSGAR